MPTFMGKFGPINKDLGRTLSCHCRRSKRTLEPLMHVRSDGLVITVPSVEVEVDCSIDTTAFPYDAQRCELEVIITTLMN